MCSPVAESIRKTYLAEKRYCGMKRALLALKNGKPRKLRKP